MSVDTFAKIKCGCKHTEPDYWCICWFEGYEMGEAEKDEPIIEIDELGNIFKIDFTSKNSSREEI